MEHDQLCEYSRIPEAVPSCQCALIAAVVKRERLIYQTTWAANLPKIEKRNYDQGFHDGSQR